MGGSGLTVQAVKDTFGEPDGLKMYSMRTTDPAVIKDILDEIARDAGSLEAALSKTLVIPISKSGTTEETVSHKRYFETLFDKFKIDRKDHLWVITDKTSPMDTGEYEQREIQLNRKGDIGGRFTAPTTRIFLLPLALVVPERDRIERILLKTQRMNQLDEPFINLGAYLYHMAAHLGKDKLTFMVPHELRDLPMWSEQLFEESLGKAGKGMSIFYGEALSEASLKDVEENDRVFLRINVAGKKTSDELWSQLREKGYPVFEIDVDDIDSIGGLMLGLQRTVATIAYLWGITFVDQPAVEGYKNATRDVMSKLQPGEKVEVPGEGQYASFNNIRLYYDRLITAGSLTQDELESEVRKLGTTMDDAPAVYAAIITILASRPGFEAKEITSYGRMSPSIREILERARGNIFTDGLRMPSKLGEGPDKNHSYQQNIEDGKDMWFSTYFMPLEVEEPQALSYDDNLIRAQTIGTVNSIVSQGRKVALITFDSTAEDAKGDLDLFFREVEDYLSDTVHMDAGDRAILAAADQAVEEAIRLEEGELSRKEPVDSMDQIIAIPASEVISNKAGFEKWISSQPENVAVVIIAMQDEYDSVRAYENLA